MQEIKYLPLRGTISPFFLFGVISRIVAYFGFWKDLGKQGDK
jgi:hypothetical protein